MTGDRVRAGKTEPGQRGRRKYGLHNGKQEAHAVGDVVRLVTPGTLTEDGLLDARAHNFLAALARSGGGGGMLGKLRAVIRVLVNPVKNVRLGAMEVLAYARFRHAMPYLVDVTRKRTGDDRVMAAQVPPAGDVQRVDLRVIGEVRARVRQAKHTHVARLQEIEQARSEAQESVTAAWSVLMGQRAKRAIDRMLALPREKARAFDVGRAPAAVELV